MKRFFVEEIRAEKGTFLIEGTEARHILKVMRMGPGDRFILMDGRGARYEVSIESCSRRDVRVLLERPLSAPPPSPVEITLAQALLKSHAMDYVIQKATELGAHRIIPFRSSRTVMSLHAEGFESKARHWEEIARNATKQSGRAKPPEIGALFGFRDLLAYGKEVQGLKAVLWEGEQTGDLKNILSGMPRGSRFFGIVGPEGGFTGEEIALARDWGFPAVSLGSRILRAETAALVLVAILQYEWGDLSFRNP